MLIAPTDNALLAQMIVFAGGVGFATFLALWSFAMVSIVYMAAFYDERWLGLIDGSSRLTVVRV